MYHKHVGYNIGILHSKGEIVTICDSDAVFPPDFVTSIFKSFESDLPSRQKSIVLMHHEWRTSFQYVNDFESIDDVKNKKWNWWPLNPNAGGLYVC